MTAYSLHTTAYSRQAKASRLAVVDVLEHLAAGKSNKKIASALAIAEGTAKNHMSQVLAKLGVLDRTQAALRARELGLL